MAFVIEKKNCIGCGSCAGICPVAAISEDENGKYEIDSEGCIDCGACSGVCPVNTIFEGE